VNLQATEQAGARHRVCDTGATSPRVQDGSSSSPIQVQHTAGPPPTAPETASVGDVWEQRFKDREVPTTTRHLGSSVEIGPAARAPHTARGPPTV
jgi:hypothetical protein